MRNETQFNWSVRWDTLDPMVAEKMPDDLRDIFMTEHDIRRFFDTIDPMSRMMSYEYLQAGGIAIPVRSQLTDQLNCVSLLSQADILSGSG